LALITSRTRVFATIWFGQLVSALGTGLTSFALGVWVFQRTGSASQFTLIAVFGALPNVITLPFAGALIDRWDRRLIMLFSSCGSALMTIAGVVLLSMGQLEVWHIYAGVMMRTVFSSFFLPSFSATTTLLISKQHLGRASGMVQANTAAVQIFAPLLGGLLLAVIQLPGVLFIDFVSYLVVIVSLLLVQVPVLPRASPTATATGANASAGAANVKSSFFRHHLTYGLVFIKERHGLLALLIYFATVNTVIASTTILFTPMLLSFTSTKVAGAVLSVLGAGFLTGSIVMSVWGGPQKRIRGILGFGALFGVCSVLIGLRPSAVLIAIGAFGMYFFLPIVNGCTEALWQTKTPPDVQGRVFAIRRLIAASTVPVSYLLGGQLADKVFEPLLQSAALHGVREIIGHGPGRGIGLMLIVGGILIVLIQVVAYLYSPLSQIEEDLPDVIPDAAPSMT
jgi:MFS family permease